MLTVVSAGSMAQNMSADELFMKDAKRRRTRLRTEWNLFAGPSFTGYSASGGNIACDPKVGYHIGIDMGILFGKHCGVLPELMFSHSAVNISGKAGGVAEVKLNSLDFPLMFEWRFLNGRIRLHAGPSFTLMNKCSYLYDDRTMNGFRMRPTVTYVAGARGFIGQRISIGVRFNGQFNRTEQIMGMESSDPDYEIYRLGMYTVSASIGYKF